MIKNYLPLALLLALVSILSFQQPSTAEQSGSVGTVLMLVVYQPETSEAYFTTEAELNPFEIKTPEQDYSQFLPAQNNSLKTLNTI